MIITKFVAWYNIQSLYHRCWSCEQQRQPQHGARLLMAGRRPVVRPIAIGQKTIKFEFSNDAIIGDPSIAVR